MIQKYIISDSIILIPAITYADKNLYSYEWYVNGILHDINYCSKYNFPKSGVYTIKLITTSNITKLATTIIKQVNVTLKSQKYTTPGTTPPPPPPAPVEETFILKTLYGNYAQPDVVIIPHDGSVGDYYLLNFTEYDTAQGGGCDFGPDGNLYIAYYANIIKYDLTNNTISSFAGDSEGYSDGNGASASFAAAADCKWGTDGYLYVIEQSFEGSSVSYAAKIRKISQSADVTTLAILGDKSTYGLAVHPINHDVYVSDYENSLIYKVTQAGVVSTVAGRGILTGESDSQKDGTGIDALFNRPWGMAFDSTGSNLYIIQQNGHNIRKMTVPEYVVTTPVGPIDGSYGDVDGTGNNVRLCSPKRITRYSDTVFYITDADNYKTKIFNPSTNDVTTFCSSSKNGEPYGLAANGVDSLYVTKEYQGLHHEYHMTDMNNLRFTGLNGIDVDSNGVFYTSSNKGLIITGSNYSDFGIYSQYGYCAAGPLYNINTKMRVWRLICNPNTNELYVNNYYTGYNTDYYYNRAFLKISGGNLETVDYIMTNGDLGYVWDMKFSRDYTKIYFIDEDESGTTTRFFTYTIATNTLSAPIFTYPESTATMISVLDASDGNLYIITAKVGDSNTHFGICRVDGTGLTELYGFDLLYDGENGISDFREYKPGKFLILGSRQIFKYVLKTNTFTVLFGDESISGSVDSDQSSSTLVDANECYTSRPYNNRIYFCNQNSIRFVQWT
jgi:hypothetical protein